MKLKNKSYDKGKWLVLIFLPSLAVFISGLSELFIWKNAQLLVSSINLFTVFLGSILQISSKYYHDDWGSGADGASIY